jgi:hypothetical protein
MNLEPEINLRDRRAHTVGLYEELGLELAPVTSSGGGA